MNLRLPKFTRFKGFAASALNLLFCHDSYYDRLFSVEICRYLIAREQLQTSLEAAVLCAQTTLASTGTPNDLGCQLSAENTALSLFQSNAILGTPMTNASLVTLATGDNTPSFDVSPGQTQIFFQFLDPITLQPVSSAGAANAAATNIASPLGTVIQAVGAYCYSSIFLQFIGINSTHFVIQSAVNSGLPQLDLVFVYDVSGAENEQTPTTYLQRYWHYRYGIDYLVPPYNGNPSTDPTNGGPITPFRLTNPPNQGPNPLPPQNLDNPFNCPNPNLPYTEQTGAATKLLTGLQAYAAPPGNYPNCVWGIQTGIQYDNSPMITFYGALPYYIPEVSTLINLNDYYALPLSQISPGLGPVWNYMPGVTITYGYVANGSGLGGGRPSPPVGGGPTLTTQIQQLILSNTTKVNVVMGGGSANQVAAVPFTPTGPHPADANGNSGVASVLSGNTFDLYGHDYTDAVVNIDNQATFKNSVVNYQGNNYKFPSLGSLVEAWRGNLESLTAAKGAGLNLTALGLTQADLQDGYYQAYMQAALAAIQPMNSVASSTIAFMNQIATVSDAHFGCVTFNDYVGVFPQSVYPPLTVAAQTAAPGGPGSGTSSSSTTDLGYNIASTYALPSIGLDPFGNITYTPTQTFLLPDIPLNPAGNTTQQKITQVLPVIHTAGDCDVADALKQAIQELTNTGIGAVARPSANKVIILITAQAPNIGLNGDTGAAALTDALSQARLANQYGIPIYCVSVSQSSIEDDKEDAAYSEKLGGIAAVAGHGSKYYRIDWSTPSQTQADLTSAFANIARRLVTVVR